MTSSKRRFEILLPLQFSDGSPVADELIGQTMKELRERFGVLSTETQITKGFWTHQSQVHQDQLMRLYLDLPDTSENIQFFGHYKDTLKERFQQLDIYVTTFLVEVL